MRARHRTRTNRSNGGGNRSSSTTENQLAFNVICLAVAISGSSNTEPCSSAFNDD